MFLKITPKNSKTDAISRVNANRVNKHYTHISKREEFLNEFCNEIDLYSEYRKFPDWIDSYREELFGRLSNNFMKMCRILKDNHIEFKIKYPIEIDRKWKFADIYIPKRKTVIIMLHSQKEFCKPIWSTPERSIFFRDRMKVIECYEYECDNILSKINRI